MMPDKALVGLQPPFGVLIVAAFVVMTLIGGCASENEGPSRIGERTREILRTQNEPQSNARPAMNGPEAHRILENYSKSIGQGGAGAPLPPKSATK